ncbi:MAG: MFS transporter [Aigarchaeota archaeon]|nr:MFS transporter [Aigarchaeota archaeon]
MGEIMARDSGFKASGWGVSRSVLFSLGSFQFLTFLRRGVFYSFMYIYLFSLIGNVTSTAALGTLNMIASTVGQNLLWGRISDRYRVRANLVVLGELIAGFFYITVFLVHRSLMETGTKYAAGLSIVFGLSLLEFFWSMSDVGWAALLADVTTQKTRGSLVGALNFVGSIGRITGIIFAGFLYEGGLGFRQGTIFYVVTAMLFTGGAIMSVTSRFIKTSFFATFLQENTHEETKSAYDQDSNSEVYRWFLVSLIVVVLGVTCVSQVFLLFLQLPDGLSASDEAVSLVLTAWTVGGMLASLVAGKLSDRLGRVKLILCGLILSAITPLLYGVVHDVVSMAIVYGLNGASFWTLQTVGFTLVGDIIPADRRGRLFSRYNAVMALSWGPAGFLIGGPLADAQTQILRIPRHTAYTNTFFVSSVLVGAGTIIFFLNVGRRLQRQLLNGS